MKRDSINSLIAWKNKKNRKPLIVRGARQVGKTWLLKEFGRQEYKQCIYVNFEQSKSLQNFFVGDFDIPRIVKGLEVVSGINIEPHNTLIILDEIQEASGGLTSLKYFCENAPQYHVVAAGSLLGIALQKQTSFPVGKVDFLTLYPLTFSEFLEAMGDGALLNLLKSRDWALIKTFKNKYIQRLKEYYFVGGMPEAVAHFATEGKFDVVRDIQNSILASYEQDFAKHAPGDIVPRIRMLWNSIPHQLAKENSKFVYGLIKHGARAKEYEIAMSWLIDCGLLHKVCRIAKPAIPLRAYEDFSAFKLFLVDVGLLGAMSELSAKTIIDGNSIFEEFKGALTEQFVLQQLVVAASSAPNYWSAEKSAAEVDFVIQHGELVVPIEVKAAENLQAKSLKSFCDKFNPKVALRLSMSDFRQESWLTNVPLYAVSELYNL